MNCIGGSNDINKTIIIKPSANFSPVVSACTALYVTNVYPCTTGTPITINGHLLVNENLSADTVTSVGNMFSGGTNLLDIFALAGSDTNTYTTGTTLLGDTVYFDRNDILSAYTLDLSSVNSGDTFVTGMTFNNNLFNLDLNNGSSLSTSIDNFTGLTVSGVLNVSGNTNINGGIFSGGTNLSDIFALAGSDTNTYTTGTTLLGDTVYFDRNDLLSAYTVNLSSVNSADTYVTGVTFSSNTLSLTRNDNVLMNVSLDDIYFSGGSGSCITDLYVTNIHGCSPITINDELIALSGITISATPINNDSLTQLLARDSSTGEIKYRGVDSIIGAASADTYVSGFTYDDSNNLTIIRNDGTELTANISVMTGLTVNGLVNSGTLFTTNLSATTVDADTILSGTTNLLDLFALAGSDTNTYTTGTTLLGDTVYFDRNDILSAYTLDLSSVNSGDTFVTGMTFNPSNYQVVATRNDGFSTTPIDLSILSADVTITGGTYDIDTGVVTFTNNSGSTFEVSGFTSGMTDSYTTSAVLSGDSITFDNNIAGANLYNVSLLPLLSGKTDVSLFNSHTGDTNNPHEVTFSALTSTAHTHTISDVINLQTELDSKALQTDLVAHTGDTNNPHNVTIEQVSGITETLFNTYTGNTETLIGAKVDTTLFDTYTGDTETALSTKVEGGANVGAGAGSVFRDKTGTTLNFRTLSGGTNTTVTTVGGVNVIDVTLPPDANTYTTGTTVVGPTLYFDRNDTLSAYTADLSSFLDNTNYYATGGTYNGATTSIDFSGNNVDANFSVDVSALLDDTNTFITGFTYDDANTLTIVRNDLASFSVDINVVTGLTVTGSLSAVTVSADTFYGDGSNLINIPHTVNTYSTGGTFNNNELIITNNTGGTFNTVIDTFTSATFTNYVDFEANGDPVAVSGRTYYDVSENALSYYPETPNMDVTINLGQESVLVIYNNTGAQINNGQACHINGAFGSSPTVELASASGITEITDTKFEVSGIATHDIPNGTYGFITNFGTVRGLTITGTTNGADIWLSDVEPGGFIYNVPTTYASRVTKLGHVITTGTTTGKIHVDLNVTDVGTLLSSKQNDVIAQNNSSTGLRGGGVITINGGDNTKFDVAAGTGVVVDNFTNPLEPLTTEISWDALTGNTVTSLTGESGTYVFMDKFGDIYQLPLSTVLTGSDRRNYIFLGILGHSNKTNIVNVFNIPNFITSPINQFNDFTYAVGPFSMSGNKISTVAGTFSLAKTSGVSYISGGNFKDDKSNPSIVSSTSLSASTLIYATGQAILGPSGTTIDNQNYDPNGLGTITALSNPSDVTAHRIWYEAINNILIFQYGQTAYSSVADARAGFSLEDFVVPSGLGEVPYLVAVLITDADNADLDSATLIPQGKFAGTGGGGGLSVTSLQTAYNNSTTPEIVTDASRGAVDYKSGSGLNANNLVTFQDDAANINASITGEGYLSASTVDGNTILSGGTNLITIIDARDNYTTGTTVIGNSVYFDTIDSLSAYTADLSSFIDDTNFYTTGSTLIGSTVYYDRNDSLSAYTTNLAPLLDDTNFYVTGGTVVGGTMYLDRNDTLSAATIDVSSLLDNTDFYTTGSTLIGNTLYFDRNDALSAYTVDLSSLNVSDTYITGGTFTNNELILTNNTGGTVNTIIDTFTGVTVNGNTTLSGLTTVYGDTPTSAAIQPGVNNSYDLGAPSFRWREIFSTNVDVSNALSTDGLYVSNIAEFYNGINVTGDTIVDGGVTATTINADTILSGGTNLTNIFKPINAVDVYLTGSTFTNNTLALTNNTGGTVNTIIDTFTGLTVTGAISATTVDGGDILSGGTNLDTLFATIGFTTFTAETQDAVSATTLNDTIQFSGVNVDVITDQTNKTITFSANTGGGGGSGEANTASNVGGGEGIFNTKTGVDLEFKSLTSTGGTITINSTGETVNIEANVAESNKYTITTGFTEFTPLVITHNLNTTTPIVQVIDSTGNLVIPESVSAYTLNTVTVTLSPTDTYTVIVDGGGSSTGSLQSQYESVRHTSGTGYTFSTNNLVVVTSNSATTVTLPASPVKDEFYVVKVRQDASLYNVTVDGNGNNIDGNSSVLINTNTNPSYIFLYDSTEYIII